MRDVGPAPKRSWKLNRRRASAAGQGCDVRSDIRSLPLWQHQAFTSLPTADREFSERAPDLRCDARRRGARRESVSGLRSTGFRARSGPTVPFSFSLSPQRRQRRCRERSRRRPLHQEPHVDVVVGEVDEVQTRLVRTFGVSVPVSDPPDRRSGALRARPPRLAMAVEQNDRVPEAGATITWALTGKCRRGWCAGCAMLRHHAAND